MRVIDQRKLGALNCLYNSYHNLTQTLIKSRCHLTLKLDLMIAWVGGVLLCKLGEGIFFYHISLLHNRPMAALTTAAVQKSLP